MELAREEFTGVELQGRVVRVQRQADAAVLCHKGIRAVEHEAMVKVLRNGVRRAEVERALGRAQLSGGNELAVHGDPTAGIDLQRRSEDALRAAEVEIHVRCGREDGVLCADTLKIEEEPAALHAIGDVHRQRAGIARVAVRRAERKAHGIFAEARSLPHPLVEAGIAAVQMVAALVLMHLHGLAVQREAAARNAVGIAADDRAEVAGVLQIVVRSLQADHDIAALIGKPCDGRTEAHHGDGKCIGRDGIHAVAIEIR